MRMVLSRFSLAGLLLGLAGLAVVPAWSQAPAAAPEVLDQKRIHYEYNEGNFDAVIADLERFMSRHKTYSHADSVFIAKHLAVVYSANTATREKGKYYMYRLLELLPSAKLVDMYVSDEIDRIFDKVREEFMTRQASFGVDTARVALPARPARDTAAPLPVDRPARPRKEGGSLKPAMWIGGGVALATATAAFILMNRDLEPEERTVVIRDRNP